VEWKFKACVDGTLI
jgi:hypothetical protein